MISKKNDFYIFLNWQIIPQPKKFMEIFTDISPTSKYEQFMRNIFKLF
jgi:hypothetical protein